MSVCQSESPVTSPQNKESRPDVAPEEQGSPALQSDDAPTANKPAKNYKDGCTLNCVPIPVTRGHDLRVATVLRA